MSTSFPFVQTIRSRSWASLPDLGKPSRGAEGGLRALLRCVGAFHRLASLTRGGRSEKLCVSRRCIFSKPDPKSYAKARSALLFRIGLDKPLEASDITHTVEDATADNKSYDETISLKGFRFTKQRRHVYDALMAQRDHPTAVEVFIRAKKEMPSISLATVYNCLETLTECGLVRHVNLDRAPSRYCPNLEEHGHFFCDECGLVFDVPVRDQRKERWELPADTVVTHHEVSLRGLCAECSARTTATAGDRPGEETLL